VRAFGGFNEWLSGEQPSAFFFLDEKEAKNQASSDGGSHGPVGLKTGSPQTTTAPDCGMYGM
jgi:hypothetical protein